MTKVYINYTKWWGKSWTIHINNCHLDYTIVKDDSQNFQVTKLITEDKQIFTIPFALPLNEINPQETIDEFFKLVMLQ